MYNIGILNNTSNPNFKSRENNMNNAPEYIKKLVKKLETATSRQEMYKILDDTVAQTSDFISCGNTCFAGSGYKFQCTLSQYADKYNIPQINRESGLEILKIIKIGNSDRCVVVSKVKK